MANPSIAMAHGQAAETKIQEWLQAIAHSRQLLGEIEELGVDIIVEKDQLEALKKKKKDDEAGKTKRKRGPEDDDDDDDDDGPDQGPDSGKGPSGRSGKGDKGPPTKRPKIVIIDDDGDVQAEMARKAAERAKKATEATEALRKEKERMRKEHDELTMKMEEKKRAQREEAARRQREEVDRREKEEEARRKEEEEKRKTEEAKTSKRKRSSVPDSDTDSNLGLGPTQGPPPKKIRTEEPSGPHIPPKGNEPQVTSQPRQPETATQPYESLEAIPLKDIILEDTNNSEAIERALQARKSNRPLNKPNGIRNCNTFIDGKQCGGAQCFANSVLQCLAAVLEPKWLKKSLGTHLNLRGSLPVYKPFEHLFDILEGIQGGAKTVFNDKIVLEMLIVLGRHKQGFLKRTNQGLKNHVIMDGSRQQDCAEFLYRLLTRLKEGCPIEDDDTCLVNHQLIDSLFKAELVTSWTCSECKHERQETETPDVFTIIPTKDKEEVANILSKKKTETEERSMECRNPACKKQSNHIQTWAGLKQLPEILIIRSNVVDDRQVKQNFNVDMPEVLDMMDYSVHEKTRTKYVLRAFLKHMGDDTNSGHYIGYVQGQQGRWWRCNDKSITVLGSRKAAAYDPGYGETYMLFYERLRDD
jgi:ubiquitin C-terminal hydrolase